MKTRKNEGLTRYVRSKGWPLPPRKYTQKGTVYKSKKVWREVVSYRFWRFKVPTAKDYRELSAPIDPAKFIAYDGIEEVPAVDEKFARELTGWMGSEQRDAYTLLNYRDGSIWFVFEVIDRMQMNIPAE